LDPLVVEEDEEEVVVVVVAAFTAPQDGDEGAMAITAPMVTTPMPNFARLNLIPDVSP
jgi:hypothetical protein